MYSFSDRMGNLKASEIREFMKIAEDPEIISFAGGMPAPELFPLEEIKEATEAVFREKGRTALQYATTEGNLRLREQIVERMGRKYGIFSDIEHVFILSGSQEGLSLSAQTFLNKGDIVLLESPTFLGAINSFRTCEAKFIDIKTDDDGMDVTELEKVLSKGGRIKLIYVIPDFQNPTGKTWSLERRKQFMEVVNRYKIPVVEDNPYGELRFEGESLPTLKSLDTKELVIYLGSFSKIFVPGFRLSWVCASRKILEKFNFLKQAETLQASTFSMMVASKYLDMFDLDEHVKTLCETYKRRKNLMVDVLKAELPEECKFTDPKGGLFTWIELPEGFDAKELSLRCLKEEKIAFVTGTGFYPNGGHNNTLRLNYSNMPDDIIVDGTRRLCKMIARKIEEKK